MSELTLEQREAVEHRAGDALLAAAAGSGKTRVLTERYVRSVVEDGLSVGSLLAITFTDKAAGELADRVRRALRDAGRDREAEEAERGWIDTIHGFCARVLRIHAVAAGVDPRFRLLDEVAAARLAADAFDEVAGLDDVPLLAAYGHRRLREAILAVHAELRARGRAAVLPDPGPRVSLAELAPRLRDAAIALGATNPAAGTVTALGRCTDLLDAGLDPLPRPDVVQGIAPPGKAKDSDPPEVAEYREVTTAFLAACADAHARPAWAALDALLGRFAAAYEEAKRERSALDFADLELRVRDLLVARPDVRARLAERFARIMVDEFQDTNPLQTEIIAAIGRDNLFTVGDELQAIYGFRHADVGNFRRRRAALEAGEGVGTLTTSFRARPDVLAVVRATFEREWREPVALSPGREAAPAGAEGEPRVELLLTDSKADWGPRVPGRSQPWREGEARALAARVAELVAAGRPAGDIVLLLRATGDLSTYERALAAQGLRTYVIGGRGYWAQPEVQDLVAWLSVLANPRDEQRLFEALASSLCGVRADALVTVAAAGRSAPGGAWRALREDAAPALDRLSPEERAQLRGLTARAVAERAEIPRSGIEAALERALDWSGFGAGLAWAPDGERRLANVRKLMRLAREWEGENGPDLRGFLALVADRAGPDAAESREGEAPVEADDLDAVRLMTIHRAKGLEFPVVCVADLGRQRPGDDNVIVRLDPSAGGRRVGLRVAVLGSGGSTPAFDYRALREDARAEADAEEKRLFYVAMTRAEERLILSGAVAFETWPVPGPRAAPISWLGPAVIPEIRTLVQGEAERGVEAGVAWRLHRPTEDPGGDPPIAVTATPPAARSPALPVAPAPAPAVLALAAAPVSHVSYSSLEAYAACGYRFYLERVLGLPPRDADHDPGAPAAAGLAATTRGSIVHTLLERLSFAEPAAPPAAEIDTAAALHGVSALTEDEWADVAALVVAFARSPLCDRLSGMGAVAREEPFSFELDGLLVSGVLDAIGTGEGRALVVDYKTNRLAGRTPAEAVEAGYTVQRLVYAVAALRGGAETADVGYAFLEVPEEAVVATFTAAELPGLEAELRTHARGIAAQEFRVAREPDRELCRGCPGRGGLCSWPVDATMRDPAEPGGPEPSAGVPAEGAATSLF